MSEKETRPSHISKDDLLHLTKATRQAEIAQIEARAILGFASELIKTKYGVDLDSIKQSDGEIIYPTPKVQEE